MGGSLLKVKFTQSCSYISTTYRTTHRDIFVPAFVDNAFIPVSQSRFPFFARKIASKTHIVEGHPAISTGRMPSLSSVFSSKILPLQTTKFYGSSSRHSQTSRKDRTFERCDVNIRGKDSIKLNNRSLSLSRNKEINRKPFRG